MTAPQNPGGDRPEPEPLPPALVAFTEYEVIRPLGRGGMAVVYLARNRLMDRLEALKLRADPHPEPEFLREVQAAARLAHPNIVAVYSARVVLGTLILAMEYVDGCDLGRLVAARGRLPVAAACELARQAALGLHHAHVAGVVHRDVKPSNLILARAGGPAALKVLDFGIARAGAGPAGAECIGTPAFAAPEQFADGAADPRSDVYALGGTLYHLLTGAPPFPTGGTVDQLRKHRDQQPPRLDAVRPGVPDGLAGLVERMLSKDPAARPATAAEVAWALTAFADPAAVTPGLADPADAGVAGGRPFPTTVATDDSSRLSPTVPFGPVAPAPRRWPRRTVQVAALALAAAGLGWVGWPRPDPHPGGPGPGGGGTRATGRGDRVGHDPPRETAASPLPGWVVDGGDASEWRLEDGVLTTTGKPKGPRTWLLTDRDYGDFVARFEYRLQAGGNSGFAFRAVPGEKPVLSPGGRPTKGAYHQQVEISDDSGKAGPLPPTGRVNGAETSTGPALRPVLRRRPAGEWYRMEVELRGQGIRVRVNEEEVLSRSLDELIGAGSLYPALSRTRGRVGFQQNERKAEFRNVVIEDIPPAAR